MSVMLDPPAALIAITAHEIGDPAVKAEAAAVHLETIGRGPSEPQAADAQGQLH